MGFYWSYMLLLSPPVLMRSCSSTRAEREEGLHACMVINSTLPQTHGFISVAVLMRKEHHISQVILLKIEFGVLMTDQLKL